MTIVTKALAIGQKTMWSNWIRYSHALWLRGCSSCPYVDDFWQDNHSKTIYVKQLALTEKMFFVLVPYFFHHKSWSCPKSPVLEKLRLLIGTGQSMWVMSSLFVLADYLFVTFSVRCKKFAKYYFYGKVC